MFCLVECIGYIDHIDSRYSTGEIRHKCLMTWFPVSSEQVTNDKHFHHPVQFCYEFPLINKYTFHYIPWLCPCIFHWQWLGWKVKLDGYYYGISKLHSVQPRDLMWCHFQKNTYFRRETIKICMCVVYKIMAKHIIFIFLTWSFTIYKMWYHI